MTGLPKDYAARKALPVYDFLTKYFPLAFLELVKVAVVGNEQHNPGEALHWARGKSMDQLNTALRHMIDHGCGDVYDDDPEAVHLPGAFVPSMRTMHLAKAAWRLLAAVQLLCEARDAAPAQAPIATKRAELAALAGIDIELDAETAFRVAQKWAMCDSDKWAKLDHALGLVPSADRRAYVASEPPEMSASKGAFFALWGGP